MKILIFFCYNKNVKFFINVINRLKKVINKRKNDCHEVKRWYNSIYRKEADYMEKFDRIHKTPYYRASLLTGRNAYGTWMLHHVGCYLDNWRGPKSYADVSGNDGKIYRIILPKRYFDKIEKLSRDNSKMNAIHDGKYTITLEKYQPEGCPASMSVTIKKGRK